MSVDPIGLCPAPNSGFKQGVTLTTTIGGSGAPVDAFPYANTNSSDCGIALIRNIETLITGKPARDRASIIALLGEPAGQFEEGGGGMVRTTTNLNAALNPIGYQATRTQVNDRAEFVTLVGQGNIMAIGSQRNAAGHIIAVAPVAPGFTDVNVYNAGPTTPAGYATVSTMPALDASRLARPQGPTGATGWIWVITPMPAPASGTGGP